MSAGYPGMSPEDIQNLNPPKPDHSQAAQIATFSSAHDQLLIEHINDKIHAYPELFSTKVRIKADEGVITLFGTVGSLQDKATLEAIVENMPDVLEVINLLELDHDGTVEKDLSGHANISLPRKEP